MSQQGEETSDKTEEPTEKKLRDAAERGDVAHSREAPLFAGLLAALAVCAFLLRDGAVKVVQVLGRVLDEAGRWDVRGGADAASLAVPIAQAAAEFLIPIALMFMLAGIAISCAQSLPSVALDRITPKLSKISPAGGMTRLFGRQGFVEFGKGAFKLATVGVVVFLLLRAEQDTMIDAMFTEPGEVPDRMLGIVIRLLSGVATAFVVLAALDFVWTRITWKNRMKMTRQEVKDEMKQSEGDPIVRAKRRSLALDRSRRRMMNDVPRATVIIANPTHYAIALRYVRGEGGAPIVLAKGTDLMALKIREIAEKNDIAIVENKPLARSMYDHVEVSQAIPPDFYKAVAEIIHHVQSKHAGAPKPKHTVLS